MSKEKKKNCLVVGYQLVKDKELRDALNMETYTAIFVPSQNCLCAIVGLTVRASDETSYLYGGHIH